MDKLKKIDVNKYAIKITHILYYVCFFYIYNFCFFDTTMYYQKAINSTNPQVKEIFSFLVKHMTYAIHLSLALAILAIVLDYKNKLEQLYAVTILSLASAFLFFHDFHYSTVVAIVFLAIAAKGKSAKRITFMAFCMGTFWLLISYWGTKLGKIEDLVYMTPKARHSFGIIYCTDFISHVLFVVLALFALHKGKKRIIDYLILAWVIYIDVYYVRGKIALICFLTFLVLTLIYQFILPLLNPIKKRAFYVWGRRITGFMLAMSAILLAQTVIYISKHYDPDSNAFYNKISFGSLKERYRFSKYAFDNFPVAPWGTAVPEQGNGGSTTPPSWYFALDISYIKILFSYGKVMLFMILSLFTLAQYKCYRAKQYYLMIILFIVALDSTVEHHLYNISYNTFLILATANLDIDGRIPVVSNGCDKAKTLIKAKLNKKPPKTDSNSFKVG